MGGLRRATVAVATTGALALTAGSAAGQQKQTGPEATYFVSAQTTSGFMAGMNGASGRPSMGAMMGMMMGGGGSGPSHTLNLQLGSTRKPAGAPEASHLPPAALRAGQSLPLVTPRGQPVQKETAPDEMPRDFQRPKGRMLIFWGCGPQAKAGQPVVIDFAKLSAGQVPPGMEALTRGLKVSAANPPSPTRSTTYGEWPNEKTRTSVPSEASLVGEHVVRGTYSPEIRFTLNQNQDFLAPLQLDATASGRLSWRTVPNAQAYLATAVGAGQDETMVLWTSSEVQASAFALPDYIGPADITRLVGSKALMVPQTTSCQIPREVIEAAPQALVQLAAYGPEANFSYPPKPADSKQPWNIDWTTKVRYRSATSAMLGMEGMGGGAMGGGQAPRGQPQPERPSVGGVLRGLGGFGF
jgi:hypothetical protein